MSCQTAMLLCVVAIIVHGTLTASANEKDLANFLAHQYAQIGKAGRPVQDPSQPIKVTITVYLNQIVNEPDDSLTIAVYLFSKWHDEFIAWDPAQFGGIKTIVMPIGLFWRPDVFIWTDFYNNWADQWREMEAIDVWVSHDGTMAWNPTGIYRVLCNPDAGYKSRKNCTFTFGSLTHNTAELDIEFGNNVADFNVSVLMPTPNLQLVSHSAAKVPITFDIPVGQTQYWNMNYNLVVDIADDHHQRPPMPDAVAERIKLNHAMAMRML